MLHADRSPEAPTSAAGDSIILHVPSCVQRFSSRRIVSRLRALARRRSRGLPEPEELPLKLQVEQNPNWLEEGARLPDTQEVSGPDARMEQVLEAFAKRVSTAGCPARPTRLCPSSRRTEKH